MVEVSSNTHNSADVVRSSVLLIGSVVSKSEESKFFSVLQQNKFINKKRGVGLKAARLLQPTVFVI